MTTRQTIKRFLEPLRQYKLNVFFSLCIFTLWSVYYAIGVIFVRWVTQAIELKDTNQLYSLLWYFLLRFIIYQVINIAWVKVKYWYIHYFSRFAIHQSYINKFFTFDHNAIEKIGTWKTMSIIQKWISTRCDLIVTLVWRATEVVCAIIFSGYLIGQISYWYLIAYVLVIVWFNFLFWIFKSKAAFWRNLRIEKATEYTRQFVKMIMSRFEIIMSNNIWKEIKILDDITEEESELDHRKHLYEHLNYNLPELLFVLFRLWMYAIVWTKIIQWELNYAELVMIVAALWYLDNTVTKIWWIYSEIIKRFGEVEKMREFFDQSPLAIWFSSWSQFTYKKWDINVKNISYQYGSSNLIFNNFSLNILWWSRIALVWPSGWGKTTLVKLIAWYLHPQSGEILVDRQALPTPQNTSPFITEGVLEKEHLSEHKGSGEVYNHISLQSYYPHIWYLTQEPSVFDGTVWENLTYGLQGKEEEQGQEELEHQIDKIIKLARCEFIYEFNNWLQTEIGEKGIRLSWWQRQRLAIAKIMLKDPDIILLDEPTSALDSENEELVTQALNELFRGKTVIVIAHRLQTVKHSDQILYIDGGQVVESWTHQELLAMKWKYYKMVELQSWF